ncbi:MAG: hypothetical protein JNK82_31380 [Myxococcaceae bacterium]|nr:hypothetical protein [Myxococcaceae bacterium]
MGQDIEMEVARGAASGAAATTAMTGALVAARRAGLMGKLPPERITERMFDLLRVRRSRTTQKAATAGAHLAYGMTAGAAYRTLVRGRVAPAHPVVEGMLFGAALWLASYQGWVPAMNIMPSTRRDRPGRQVALGFAHLVFGGLLGWLSRRRY